MRRTLTMAEIDATGDILGGRVLYHSADREEFDRRSLDYRVPSAAVVYTGEPSADMAIVL